MSTALALRLEFAMRSLEVAASVLPEVELMRHRIESLRPLVDQAIKELSS